MAICEVPVPLTTPVLGAADAEINVPSAENTRLWKALSLKAWNELEHIIACFAYCKEFCLPENATVPIHSASFIPRSSSNVVSNMSSESSYFMRFDQFCFSLIYLKSGGWSRIPAWYIVHECPWSVNFFLDYNTSLTSEEFAFFFWGGGAEGGGLLFNIVIQWCVLNKPTRLCGIKCK